MATIVNKGAICVFHAIILKIYFKKKLPLNIFSFCLADDNATAKQLVSSAGASKAIPAVESSSANAASSSTSV